MLAYGGCLSLSFSHTLSMLCLCYVFFRGVGDAAKMPPLPCILKHVFLSGGNLCWWNVMYMLMAHVLPWLFDSVLGSSSSSSSFPLLLFWLMLLFFFAALSHCCCWLIVRLPRDIITVNNQRIREGRWTGSVKPFLWVHRFCSFVPCVCVFEKFARTHERFL